MTFGPSRRACEMMLWFILFFGVAAFGATEWWSRALLEFFIFILAAMCCLRSDFNPPSGGPLIGFLAIIVLGAVQALNVRPLAGPAGLLPFTAARPQTEYALLMWAAMAALYWSASGILLWEGALRRLALAIFVIGMFIAVVGILQRGQGNTTYYGLRPVRHGNPFGPFTNYDDAANWMAASTLIGTGLFAERLLRRVRVPLADRFAQLTLAAFILCISVAAILETGSRGAINAFLASALATLFLTSGSLPRARSRRVARAGLILTGGFYAYFLYLNPKWLGFVGGALESSAAYRVSMYRSGLGMLADFPFFGIGLGGFQNAFHPYQEHFVVGLVDHGHSSWLEIALEAGMFGAVAIGAALLAPLAAMGRRLTQGSIQAAALCAGLFAALLALVMHGFVEFNFQIPANATLLVVLLAATSAAIFVPSKDIKPVIMRLRAGLVVAFALFALLSIPPGMKGWGLRFGPPFFSSAESLVEHPITPIPKHMSS